MYIYIMPPVVPNANDDIVNDDISQAISNETPVINAKKININSNNVEITDDNNEVIDFNFTDDALRQLADILKNQNINIQYSEEGSGEIEETEVIEEVDGGSRRRKSKKRKGKKHYNKLRSRRR
jgi:hypothetical protein